MTTSVTLVSPGKQNQHIQINSPIIRALNSFQSKALPPDHSWDNEIYVSMRAVGKGDIICNRDRPDERHAKLKTKVKAQDARFAVLEEAFEKVKDDRARDHQELNKLLKQMTASEKKHAESEKKHAESEKKHAESEKKHAESEKQYEKQRTSTVRLLQTTIANLERTILTMVLVEEYEVVDGILKAFNDRIYDLHRGGLTSRQKQILKANKLPYILQLLDYTPESEYGDPDATPVEQAFRTAEGLLTQDEWALCYRLQAHRKSLRDPRNTAQHLRPDRSTAERWLTQIAPEYQATFINLLDSNPLRMMTIEDDYSSDLRIVVGDGEYEGPEVQQALLAQLQDTLAEIQHE